MKKIPIISFNFTSQQHTFLHNSEVEKRSRCISIHSPAQDFETSNAFIHNTTHITKKKIHTFCFQVLLPIASCTSLALKNIHSSLWNSGLSYFDSCGWPWLGAPLLLKQPLSEPSLYRNQMNTLDHIFKITCYNLLSSIVSHHTYRSD